MSISQMFKSKTVLFGCLLTIASVIQAIIPFFPPEYIGVAGTFVGIVVVVLRFVTTLPLDEK